MMLSSPASALMQQRTRSFRKTKQHKTTILKFHRFRNFTRPFQVPASCRARYALADSHCARACRAESPLVFSSNFTTTLHTAENEKCNLHSFPETKLESFFVVLLLSLFSFYLHFEPHTAPSAPRYRFPPRFEDRLVQAISNG